MASTPSFTDSGSTTSSNSNSLSYRKNMYGKTTTSNPYITSRTTNGGTTSNFAKDSALDYINNYVSNNIGGLIDSYLNPSIDNSTNQALLENYKRNLADTTSQNLQNDIIAPLTDRNMLRSSQATAMYNNLMNSNQKSIDNYTAELLRNSQSQEMDKLATLYNMYMTGYNAISGNQAQSLETSAGNSSSIGMGNEQKESQTSGYSKGFNRQ